MELTNEVDYRSSIQQLGMPQILFDIFDGGSVPRELQYRCARPVNTIKIRPPVTVAGHQITPLWECGITVTAYQWVQGGRFIELSLENPDDFVDFGKSFQAVVANLFIFLWEDMVAEDRLREIAKLFSFTRIDELLAGCVATNNADYNQRTQWHHEFVRSFR